jgi:hypothetical protein
MNKISSCLTAGWVVCNVLQLCGAVSIKCGSFPSVRGVVAVLYSFILLMYIKIVPIRTNLTLSLTAVGPISPISLKCHILKKFLSGIKAILHVFLF